jgi:predicted transcriptional regulator
MSTLTLRLPEDLANRLKNTAEARGVSVNKHMTEISVQALAAYDAETRFKGNGGGSGYPRRIGRS